MLWIRILRTHMLLAASLIASLACQFVPASLSGQPTATQISTQAATPCAPEEAPAEDMEAATSYAEEIFTHDLWTPNSRSYNRENSRIALTWLNYEENAVAALNYFLYECGTIDSDYYLSDDNLEKMYANYEWELLATCESGSISLAELKLTLSGDEFYAREWFHELTDQRAVGVSLLMPVELEDRLDETAEQLYPELPACE